MSFASRLGLLALAAGVVLAVYHWQLLSAHPPDVTRAALRQFENSDAAAADLRLADTAKHWWVVAAAAGLVLLWTVLFWEDVERLWRRRETAVDREDR